MRRAGRHYLKFWRAESSLPSDCVKQRHNKKVHRCAVARNSIKFIRTPIFFVQALTDSVVMSIHDNWPLADHRFVHEPDLKSMSVGVVHDETFERRPRETKTNAKIGRENHRRLELWCFRHESLRRQATRTDEKDVGKLGRRRTLPSRRIRENVEDANG